MTSHAESCRCCPCILVCSFVSQRYEYQHSISNANLLAERRVSITFRECPLSKAKPQFEGVQYTPMAKRYKWGRKL